MKNETYALLAGILVVMLSVNLVAADGIVIPVDVGANPVVNDPKVCVYTREVSPDGINNCNARFGQYAFVGETIFYRFIVRDFLGAEDIGFAKLLVGPKGSLPSTEYEQVLCNPINLIPQMRCDGLGIIDPELDKAFECLLTVEPDWYDELELTIVVYDINNMPTVGHHKETWFFNPAISLEVELSEGTAIGFEDGGPGDCVHSTNRLEIRNNAEGGMNLWIFLAGTDLYGEGAAKCPDSNVLEIHNMKFRGWSGTEQPGHDPTESLPFDQWIAMSKYDENAPCDAACWMEDGGIENPFVTCYGGRPVPGQTPVDNILTNDGLMEVEFKLCYPYRCIGHFGDGQIYVFGKAI